MAVSLRDEDVQELNRALQAGKADIEGLLSTLRGQAVQGIHKGLEGTQTAGAFDEKITQFEKHLLTLTPQFEELGAFVTKYLQQFHETDAAQAAALR